MERIAKFVLKHRKLVLFFFLSATVVSIFLMPFVRVNYNLADYVPSDAPSTEAMREMEREFEQSIPNAQVYIPDISIPQALEYKRNMIGDANILDVIWLDDVVDLRQPLAMQDQQTVDGYYLDGGALFQVTVDEEDYTASLASLRALVGPDAAISGQVVDQANARAAVNSEMATIIIIAVPLALVILTISTHSWLEPLLLLLAIGVAVVLNMGTNIIFGEVSYITQSIAAVLQLAVSMDYAIFMLHRFNQYRQEGYETVEAMEKAMTKAFSAITSSAMTTIFGFLALVFMRFQLGPDMGLVLAKGVIFSLISVMFLLPIVTIYIYKWIDKTTHRPFLPNFAKLGKAVIKIRWVLLVLVILVVIPSYLAQSHNTFFYGMGAYEENSRELLDRQTIEEKFGNNMQMAILVPNDSRAKEKELDRRLKNLPDVKSVISLTGMAGAEIPIDILPQEQVRQLRSDQYSLFIVIADSLAEGDHAFGLASDLRAQVEAVYPQGAHLAGENFSTLDMRDTIRKDNRLVNGLAILAVGIVLLITFRSVALALILLLTIEASIWINLAIPYFQGTNLSFIGYLVISTVQLGATIDYGILFSQHYMDNRKLFGKITSAQRAYAESVPALLPPALILTTVGFILGIVSSLDVVSELGIVLGRGALLSLLLVTTFLPALLLLFDPIIERTTWKPEFHKK
ncbi:MAG: efflux RND transporter permease subunit [Fastidiosipilaceae bacterium]